METEIGEDYLLNDVARLFLTTVISRLDLKHTF